MIPHSLKLTALALLAVLAACAAPAAAVRPSVMTIEEGLVDNGGVLIYFKSVGRGPPLVIVHGGPGASHDYLLPNVYRLAASYRLVFIDERGSGRSPRLEDASQYTVEKMADDVEAVRCRSPARQDCPHSATRTVEWSCRLTPSSTRITSVTSSWAARSPAPVS